MTGLGKPIKVLYPGDFELLPGEWRLEAMRCLLAIRDDPDEPKGYRHKLLENQEMMRGDLSGLHSVAFGSAVDYYSSWRIVYRVTPEVVEVIAIGERTGSEVFKIARDRIYPKSLDSRRLTR